MNHHPLFIYVLTQLPHELLYFILKWYIPPLPPIWSCAVCAILPKQKYPLSDVDASEGKFRVLLPAAQKAPASWLFKSEIYPVDGTCFIKPTPRNYKVGSSPHLLSFLIILKNSDCNCWVRCIWNLQPLASILCYRNSTHISFSMQSFKTPICAYYERNRSTAIQVNTKQAGSWTKRIITTWFNNYIIRRGWFNAQDVTKSRLNHKFSRKPTEIGDICTQFYDLSV